MNKEKGVGWISLALMASALFAGCGGDSDSDPGLEFLNLRVEEVGTSRSVVRFDTSRPTSCEVEYGLSELMLGNTATDPTMAQGELAEDHDVPLEDLAPDTTYYFRTRATDSEGRTYFSSMMSFSTKRMSSVDTSNMTNVALMSQGASVTMVSSNFGGVSNAASAWGANNAIDGLMATEWSSNGDGDDAFMVIDLGQVRTLQALSFRSRKMTNGTAIIQSVRLIFDGDASTATSPIMTPDPNQLYRFLFAAPVNATQVRIEAMDTTGGNTGAKEIQLFSMIN